MNTEKQLTAVDFLLSKTAKHCFNKDEIEKARAMEKQYLCDFYIQGSIDYITESEQNVKDYYNKTFKSE